MRSKLLRRKQRTNVWCLNYTVSDLPATCRVCSSTSRRPPSRTSSDWHRRLDFLTTPSPAAASETDRSAAVARFFVLGSVGCARPSCASSSCGTNRRLCLEELIDYVGRLVETVKEKHSTTC